MAKKIQMMSHDKEWQIVNGVETLVPVEQIDIDPITDSSAVQIEGHRTLEETLATKHQMTPEIDETKIMSKVGGVYHQNVVDGAYEEAILYGNSKVNVMEDDTTTAQSIPLTFTSFNNGLQKELALGTNTVAPMLKGATLINRALTNSVTLASGEKFYIHNLKGNTVHTVSFKFTTKNTNAGVVIESCTGETYLENSMHKTGLGDNVIFTVTTHANADSIAIVNNAAYGGETIQLDDIMVIEGDQTLMDLTFFKGMHSVELVKPLTNLFTDSTPTSHSFTDVTNNSGNVVATSQKSSAWTYACYNIDFKSNTSYVIMWDSLSYTQTGNENQTISVCYGNDIIANRDNMFTNKRSIIFNTGDRDVAQINLRIHATTTNTETGTTTVKGLRVFEYDSSLRALDLQSIGYFSGTKNVSIPNFKTNSKNLYPYGDINFTPTQVQWHDAKGTNNMYGDIAQKSKCRFLLRKGTYKLSSDYYNRTNLGYMSLVTDKEEIIGDTTFTLDKDTYLTLRLQPVEANVPTTLTNIQIERGDTATDYVAYNTRQYKPDNQKVITLRSLPNGVCDTFNLQTGEYTRRIGEVVLNGSENWGLNKTLGDGSFNQFVVSRVQAKKVTAQLVNCDKLISDNDESINNRIWIYDGTTIVVHSSCASVDELRTWLQQNPLTVQYEFAQPATEQIPTVNNIYNTTKKIDFKESKNANFRCFGNPTYLEVGSLSPVNPIVQPIINVPLNARLKANTSYTVRLDRTGSSLNIDLGGTTVSTTNSTDNEFIIKTPTGMLSHNQIRFGGNGSVGRVMVFEGDIRGIELPYFMGINNVKMPIVRNCGRNLVDFDRDKSGWWIRDDGLHKDNDGNIYSVVINASPNYYYTVSKIGGNRNFYGFLDKDYNVIYWDSNKTTTILAPLNTKYLIWYLSATGLTKENNIMITASREKNNTSITYQPYRSNDICIAQGEIGLSQDMFEQGTTAQYTANIGKTYQWMKENSTSSWNVRRLRIKSLIKVEPNTKLILQNRDNFMYAMGGYGADKLSLGTFDTGWIQNTIITIPQDVHYISYTIRKKDDTNITINDFNQTNFALLKPDKTIALRSLPNGVKDELNLLTGKYIQRVGEIVLDGSDDLTYNYESNSNDTTTMVHIPNLNKNRVFNFCNDKLIQRYVYDKTYIIEGIFSEWNGLYVRLLNTKLSSPNPDGVKQYLQQNPITVQYELAEPIISYPRIVSNTQEREVGVKLPNGVCDTYNPSTGITVKRVGFIEFNGTEDWHEPFAVPTSGAVSMYNIWTEQPLNNAKPAPTNERIPGVCDSLKFKNSALDLTNEEFYFISPTGRFNMNLSRSKLSEPTEQALKTYLSQNPIKLWYELKNPIVTTDIVLPNGVHDEYNPLTGLYTKRVGCIEFDGSNDENWEKRVWNNPSYSMFNIPSSYAMPTQSANNVNVISNSLPSDYEQWNNGGESITVFRNPTRISITYDATKINTVDDLRTYLSQNPLKVWYELATSITYQLTPYFGLPMPYAYKDGYLIMDSAYDGQTLPPEIKYKLLANRTGQITQNNIKLQNHTSKLSNLEAMLVEATLQSMYEREMMAFNLEMVNINLINLEE